MKAIFKTKLTCDMHLNGEIVTILSYNEKYQTYTIKFDKSGVIMENIMSSELKGV